MAGNLYILLCIQMQAPTHAHKIHHKQLEGADLSLKSISNPN